MSDQDISEIAEAVASLTSLKSHTGDFGRTKNQPSTPEPKDDSSTEKKSEVSEHAQTWIETAAERVRQIPWLRPEQWENLDIYQKTVTLNSVGRALAEVYQIPSPPLIVQELGHPRAYGSYGDGYRLMPGADEIEGADYGIKMNISGGVDFKKLFGDDPAVALETYAHEFRHSYQSEQVNRYHKPQFMHLVDDITAARKWAEPYISPGENFQAYLNQPVEKDAREFAKALVSQVYG